MRAVRKLAVLAMTAAPLTGACFQSLDTNAANGTGPAPAAVQGTTTWQICQSPSCDLPNGEVPVNLTTPPVYLSDGTTTNDPCDQVRAESLQIRKTYCAGCHESPASMDGFSFVLDDARLATALSQTATNPDGTPQRLLVPGQPYTSRLYQRVAAGLGGTAAGMPPTALAGYPSIPRPSVKDVSVLYAWIQACIAGADAGGYDVGGGAYGTGGAADAGDDGGV
jgi:hypothetical protein